MAVRRSRVGIDRRSDHPTRALIVEAAANLLREKGVVGFHVDDVLAATGLTRGAVYHHFNNVDDLVESALLATYTEGVSANIELVRKVLSRATDFDEFRVGILQANTTYAQNARLRDVRKLRAHAMASGSVTGRLATGLAREQQRLTDEYVAVIAEAQRRGWVRSEIDPLALAVFIQAYSFGVIVDDVSELHVDLTSWEQIIAGFFEQCVFASGMSPKDGS